LLSENFLKAISLAFEESNTFKYGIIFIFAQNIPKWQQKEQ
jgi:hypothetical protein